MVVNKRRKSGRKQGSGTHGWGKNKHRNSGSRGGYGNAGTGKKADTKKSSIWTDDYFGKYGFVNRNGKEVTTITLRDVDDKISHWIKEKKAKQEAGMISVDLKKLGYDKLLSTGKLTRKIKITVPTAVANAAEKIKAAGGELVVDK